ncbi:MAG: CDP-alcohol phosphatidyltransferase family protein [Verrucomicrobiales bacterium]|nr:CDP-alcohol phosphatidyltransferase family protein [Verrucomicrobiales bacterium]MED5587148.1 CDP-alcohol phosphatidyltransferase family protein [Verrucomicrobiota bacterium]
MKMSLFEMHRKTRRSLEAWWGKCFLVPSSSLIAWLLLKFFPRVHPNQVTTVSLLLGALSAAFFLLEHTVAAVLVYQLCMVLDWVDGKVARLTGKTSAFGAFYDGLVNHLVYIMNVIGLGFGMGVSWQSMALVTALLGLRGINNYLNDFLEREIEGSWSHFVADKQSWLSRNGLLPPGSFPDKHAIMFLACPLAGYFTGELIYPLGGMVLIILMDAALLALKIRKATRRLCQ